eukprot:TRINITY_DN14108_c0_g1_i1.p1 TRINITY_DN14108_c0_g1~~TRINITY_DN14108_c0_g1_i1.p1  ORF type:complete len:436 (-),score=77.46 TRINITY_DN14108_c0_g1_i1:16-1170(-)
MDDEAAIAQRIRQKVADLEVLFDDDVTEESLLPFEDVSQLATEVLKLDNEPELALKLGRLVFMQYATDVSKVALAGHLIGYAIDLAPNSSEALYWGGRIYERLGEGSKALLSYEKAHSIQPSAEALVGMGMLYNRMGDTRQALRHFLDALGMAPDSDNIKMNIGSAYLSLGNYEKSKMWLEMALKGDPDNYELLRVYGYLHSRMGDKEKALELLTSILHTHEDHPHLYDIHQLIGDIYVELQRPNEAKDHFSEAVVLSPDNISPYLRMGNVFISLQDPNQATVWFQKALQIEPDSTEALNHLATAFLSMDKEPLAIECLERILELDENNFEARLNFATLCNQNGDYKKAESVMRDLKPNTLEEKSIADQMWEIIQKGKALSIDE